MSTFSSIGSIIPQFAKSYGFDLKILEARLQANWAHIVGDSLASHTRPDSIKFRKLFLLAENSAWLQQLVFLKPMILEKLNTFAAEAQVTDIVLRIGTIQPSAHTSTHTSHPTIDSVNPTGAAVELANSWTVGIQEPALRAMLVTVIAKGLSLNAHPPRSQA
ncbi:MAG: hypothetical protein NPIRA02_15440 [Nitrospirales bacterium]|nr:MAG: hypothetical protein NPIRA02_15440 [Nitrospirales bacterium]